MKLIIRVFLALLVLCCVLLWALFFSTRPANTTDPAVLAGDGSTVNYCKLPDLDGNGKDAADIPKGNTPGCSYTHFPLPVLTECTEPLVAGADDIRGLWLGEDGTHVERIEQCGRRVVITSSGIIHDYGPNSTLAEHTNDTEGVLFRAGGRAFCPRTSASMIWNEGILEFHAFGWGPIVVRRYLDADQLVWEYLNGSVTRMNRICTLPAAQKYPRR